MAPEPKDWSGPTNRDARIKRQLDGHIASKFGLITDQDYSNSRLIDDAPYWGEDND
jgi:hypothetical protein